MRRLILASAGSILAASPAFAQAVSTDVAGQLTSAVDLSNFSTSVVTIGTSVLTVTVGMVAFLLIKRLITKA